MKYFYYFDFNLAKKETKKREHQFLKRHDLFDEYQLSDNITLELASKVLDKIIIELKENQYGHAKLFYENLNNTTLKNMILKKLSNDDFFINVFDNQNKAYVEVTTKNSEGALILNDKFSTIEYLKGKNKVTKIILSKNIRYIAENAFENFHHLKEVVYPSDSKANVVSPRAFKNSTIKKITLSSSIEVILEDAFLNSNLEEVVFLENSRLTTIYPGCFAGLKNLKEIHLPKTIKHIYQNTFLNSSNLEKVIIDDDSLLEVLDLSAFKNTKITSLNVSNNVKRISNGDILELDEIIIAPKNYFIKVKDNTIYSYYYRVLYTHLKNNKEEELIIPKEVEVIEENAFLNNENLKKVTFEQGSVLETIKRNAFRGSKIQEIKLPKSLEVIKEMSFLRCYDLKRVTFETNSNLKYIENNAFSYTKIKKIEFDKNVERVSFDAFYFSLLEEIKLSKNNKHLVLIDGILYDKNLKNILLYPPKKRVESFTIFKETETITPLLRRKAPYIKEIIVEEGNQHFINIDGVLYDKEVKTLIYYPPYKEGETYIVPETVEKVQSYAIYHTPNLKEIKVHPKNKHYVAVDGVLYDFSMKTLIKYPDGKQEETFVLLEKTNKISSYAFFDVANLKEIKANINNYPYHTDRGVLYEDNFRTIVKYPPNKEGKAFIIPNEVEKIYNDAFNNTIHLKNILFTNDLDEKYKEGLLLNQYNIYQKDEWYTDISGKIIIKRK